MLRCLDGNHHKHQSKHDDNPTFSFFEQGKIEDIVGNCYLFFKNAFDTDPGLPQLLRKKHEAFLMKGLSNLAESYICLDASRPWICYWILHSLELLNVPIPDEIASSVAQFLKNCQCPEGGFAGGPGQLAHLAPTYAAVNALCLIGTEEAYQVIDRPNLAKFIKSRLEKDGSFTMHGGGEVDIRGAYCAASVARLTAITTPEMFENTHDWIVGCQTYEGGFAGIPGMEAHGGYSFCGLATLILLGHEKLCNLKSLLRWTAARQMPYEGGFQGRTNKLVDGCYSFWQGGAFPLIHMVLTEEGDNCVSSENWMFHQQALQEYLLLCCQHATGGLIDKPGKHRDYYHTCYCLSGLSVAQHLTEGNINRDSILGHKSNELMRTHPVFNIGIDAVERAKQYFSSS